MTEIDDPKRDLSFEAMLAVCGYSDTPTQSERGRINAALKELRAIYPESTKYALAVDIHARAATYERKFPGMEVTPQALVGNWSRLDPFEDRPPIAPMDRPPKDRCATCDGLRMVTVNVRSDGQEEMAPCPDCHPNPMMAGFWRFDGSRHNPPEPRQIRAAMLTLLEGESHDV